MEITLGLTAFGILATASHTATYDTLTEEALIALAHMYVLAAFRNREFGVAAEIAHMYPACWIGSWAVAMMGLRTRLGLISGQVDDDP